MKNEGIIERAIQITISTSLFLGGFFWLGGKWQITLLVLAGLIGIFAVIGFCPFYALTGKNKTCSTEIITGKKAAILVIYAMVVLVAGSYASNFFTKKIFLQDFNAMNSDYKQTLFETGQGKRKESKENYDKLVKSYARFKNKYLTYHPYVLKGDTEFNADLNKIEQIIMETRDGVYEGNLKEVHLEFEKIRFVTQDILKRNGFSLLTVTLVDFHDSMEKMLDAANAKEVKTVIDAYGEANEKLIAVEREANDAEIQTIRKKMDELLQLAKENKVDALPVKAAELKSSFVKVYLARD